MQLPLSAKEILLGAYQTALSVADPQIALPPFIAQTFPHGLTGRVLVVGAGKASASMADALEKFATLAWPNAQLDGVVVTRYAHDVAKPLAMRKIQVRQAAHPVPDQAGMDACGEIMQLIKGLLPQDHLIVLMSGGGSSLLTLPVDSISLLEMQVLTKALLRSGAPIEQMNVVRKHLSQIQGGNLARAAVQQGVVVHTFIISDVVGDRPEDIASGPCAPDSSTYQEALDILQTYHLDRNVIGGSIWQHLEQGAQGLIAETLKETDPIVGHLHNYVYATAMQSLAKAAQYCESLGIQTIVLGDQISGEAKEQALIQLALLKQLRLQTLDTLSTTDVPKTPYTRITPTIPITPITPITPIAILSAGETTVTILPHIKGRGGRCSEFLLAFLDAAHGLPGVSALAADTDGIDGSEQNAGAYFDQAVLAYIETLALDRQQFLEQHDAYGFFEAANALVVTGPTLTNVNDFRIILSHIE